MKEGGTYETINGCFNVFNVRFGWFGFDLCR
jgi:hypothetical protein